MSFALIRADSWRRRSRSDSAVGGRSLFRRKGGIHLYSRTGCTRSFPFSQRNPPELCCIHRPRRCRGRREDRVPAGTRGPLCESVCFKKAAQRHTGLPQHPAFPAQWVYGLCRALLGERCTIAPVALRMTDARARLGLCIAASLGAQTPGARTTRFCRTRGRAVVCALRPLTE